MVRQICVFVGTGFVGMHLLARLNHPGRRLRVVSRHPERHRELRLIPGAQLRSAGTFGRQGLVEQIDGCDAVINLIGILNERGHRGLHHRRGPPPAAHEHPKCRQWPQPLSDQQG